MVWRCASGPSIRTPTACWRTCSRRRPRRSPASSPRRPHPSYCPRPTVASDGVRYHPLRPGVHPRPDHHRGAACGRRGSPRHPARTHAWRSACARSTDRSTTWCGSERVRRRGHHFPAPAGSGVPERPDGDTLPGPGAVVTNTDYASTGERRRCRSAHHLAT